METENKHLLPIHGDAAATAGPVQSFLEESIPSGLTVSSADYYFNSYNHYGVHEEVLKDLSTTSSYQTAIRQNSHLFRGAVVLDVCSGLGFCGLLAAQAGARRVIALESQPQLVNMGSSLALKNGFGPEKLVFVCGSAQTIDQLPDGLEKVDIIVSLWMGYFMMYESRLIDVLTARDRWLKPSGLLFPDRGCIHVSLLEDAAYKERHIDYYNNVWGFNFSAMKAAAMSEPVINWFDHSQLLSSSACILELDLYTCKPEDCFEMAASFELGVTREGKMHALLFWFDIRFDSCHKSVAFSTAPDQPATCWKQTALFFGGTPPTLKMNECVSCMVAVHKPFEPKRNLDIKLSYHVGNENPQIHFYRWC